jgi:hypothetical protein
MRLREYVADLLAVVCLVGTGYALLFIGYGLGL